MPKVLVIDDDPETRIKIETLLSSDGFTVETHANGEDALTSLQRGQIDLVIIDYHLNNQSGLSILQMMRERQSTASMIIISADFNHQVAGECFRVGVDDFVRKPIDAEELRLVVRRTLHAKSIARRPASSTSREHSKHKYECSLYKGGAICDCCP